MPSAIAIAGASGLLKLVRCDGATQWTFAEAINRQSGALLQRTSKKNTTATQTKHKTTQRKTEFEHEPAYGQCVGTLRWSGQDAFPLLCDWPLRAHDAPPLLTGWRGYLEMRMPADSSGTIKVDAPLLDGLSYPLSLMFALQKLRLTPPQPGPLYVLIIGASSKAEERLMRESNCA